MTLSFYEDAIQAENKKWRRTDIGWVRVDIEIWKEIADFYKICKTGHQCKS